MAVPETMRAFVLHGHGDFDVLKFHNDWPTPVPHAEQVLLHVKACGLNNTDINTRIGWYAKSVTAPTSDDVINRDQQEDGGWDGEIGFPRIQGGDAVGEVVAVGAGVDRSLLGKRCLVDTVLRDWSDPFDINKCQYLGSGVDGGFADYLVIDHHNVCPIDSDWTDAELATVAIAYSTAENLLNRVGVSHGNSVLITGASGGVGSALVQLVNRRGAQSIAMAAVSKHAQLQELNPTAVLDRQPEDLKSALCAATGKDKVDAVIDVVGGDQFPALLEVIKRGGSYACAGAIAGPVVDLDLRTMYLNDLTFHGCTIFEPNVFPDLVRYIEAGEIKPMLAASYPLEELHDAQRAFSAKQHTGNIVVTMS